LQKDSGAYITIPKSTDASQRIEISGSKESIDKAKVDITQILGIEVSHDPIASTELDVPKNRVGSVIGHGGATIKELQAKHRVLIHVEKDSGLVSIQGVKNLVDSAHAAIEALVGHKLHAKKRSEASIPMHSMAENFVKMDLDAAHISEVLFFPDDDTHSKLTRIISYLLTAKSSIDVCVYTITDDRLSNALMDAKKRGVNVRVITDDDQALTLGSDIEKMKEHGIPIRMDNSPSNMHNKFSIIDHKVILNGSFNWTRAASTANRENVVITNEKDLIIAFSTEFERLWTTYSGHD